MRYFLHKQKLPEVLVSRDQHPLIDCRSLQERTITGIRTTLSRFHHIMCLLSQLLRRMLANAAFHKELHHPPSCTALSVNVDDVIDKLALRQKAHDHIHRNPHAANDRSPGKVHRIGHNPLRTF